MGNNQKQESEKPIVLLGADGELINAVEVDDTEHDPGVELYDGHESDLQGDPEKKKKHTPREIQSRILWGLGFGIGLGIMLLIVPGIISWIQHYVIVHEMFLPTKPVVDTATQLCDSSSVMGLASCAADSLSSGTNILLTAFSAVIGIVLGFGLFRYIFGMIRSVFGSLG